jgi:putative transposase
MWNLPPPPGFRGLISNQPLTVYSRHLPHWRQDGATYFVTFRLADSLPQIKLDELASLKQDWERQHPLPRSEVILQLWARQASERLERWLDEGMGKCVLKEPSLAALLTSALHHFDNDRYELHCFVIMPNHVHAMLRPLRPEYPLEEIVGSWKKFSARQINHVLGQSGELWQEETYDRIVRDEEHLWRVIQYIGSNSDRAGLSRASCPLWIRPQWIELGWNFEDSPAKG